MTTEATRGDFRSCVTYALEGFFAYMYPGRKVVFTENRRRIAI